MPEDLRDLVERVARHHHGLGFLHQGYPDNVALTLGVHPFVVDATRAWLETEEGRAEIIEAVKAAQRGTGPLPAPGPRRVRAGDPGSPGPEVEALLEAAARRTGGVRFLAEGPSAEVAKSFGSHPWLVFRARVELERRGSAT